MISLTWLTAAAELAGRWPAAASAVEAAGGSRPWSKWAEVALEGEGAAAGSAAEAAEAAEPGSRRSRRTGSRRPVPDRGNRGHQDRGTARSPPALAAKSPGEGEGEK